MQRGRAYGCLADIDARTGVAPTMFTASAVAINVCAGTTTLSPGRISSAQSEHDCVGAVRDAEAVLNFTKRSELFLKR